MAFPPETRSNPYIRYLAPFLLFVLAGTAQSALSDAQTVWLFYGIKMAAVAAMFCLLFRGLFSEITGRPDGLAVVTGLIVLAVWLAHYEMFAEGNVTEAAFNPTLIESPQLAFLAVAVRLLGACIVIPVLEEVVFRSFLMRFLVQNDFLKVPIGTYTPLAFWGAVIAFMAVHAQWQWSVAAFAGVAYGAYLVRTKNLWGAITAHAVTNLGLGLYALATGQWGLWG